MILGQPLAKVKFAVDGDSDDVSAMSYLQESHKYVQFEAEATMARHTYSSTTAHNKKLSCEAPMNTFSVIICEHSEKRPLTHTHTHTHTHIYIYIYIY